ncbi:MAG: CcdB family protein [Sulfuricella sp.]|jgi:toxin CcdB|nr:CcdB family protein [Sulfuricella sp.]
MAQFDVHRNTGQRRETIPYVVVVQSSLFDKYRRRVVVPLVRRSALGNPNAFVGSRMNPVFTVEGVEVVLHPLEMVSVALEQLGEKADSLARDGDRIADALDELLTRSWA